MDIEEFVSEENHMCNLGDDLFYKIFEFGAMILPTISGHATK